MQEFSANSAEVTQHSKETIKEEFPGLVASVQVECKPTPKHQNLAETMALGFGVLSLICAHTKKGAVTFVIKPILSILSGLFVVAIGVGTMSLFIGVFYSQIVGADAIVHAKP